MPIISTLLEKGANIVAFDPIAQHEAEEVFGDKIAFAGTLEAAATGRDAILIITRWPEFSALPDLISSQTDQPLIVDGRRMLDKQSVARYTGIGLGA